MLKKIYIGLLYVLFAILIYLYGENILTWIRSSDSNSVILTSIIATILALFPIIPYPVVGGVIGAAYGTGTGAVITWIGSSLASIFMFLFVRYGYQDWGIKLIQSYKPLGKITNVFEKNAFITIFATRLIPIIPSIIINIYSALSRVHFVPYAIASSLGKMPSMFLFAIVGNTLVTNPIDILYIVLYYGLFLGVTYSCYTIWKKRITKVKST